MFSVINGDYIKIRLVIVVMYFQFIGGISDSHCIRRLPFLTMSLVIPIGLGWLLQQYIH